MRGVLSSSAVCVGCVAFLDLLDDGVHLGIAGAKGPRQPVSAAGGNGFAVDQHIKLAALAWHFHRVDASAFLDQGRETRGLRFIAASSRTMNDFDFHLALLDLLIEYLSGQST